jgi:hypothetical protein
MHLEQCPAACNLLLMLLLLLLKRTQQDGQKMDGHI